MIDLMKGDKNAKQLASKLKLDEVMITSITLYELYLGELIVGRDLLDIKEMERDFKVEQFNEQYAEEAARIQSELIKNGTKIPAMDALIAGIARKNNAILITDDEHFKKVEGLEVKFYKQHL